jgi:hypothetical protein
VALPVEERSLATHLCECKDPDLLPALGKTTVPCMPGRVGGVVHFRLFQSVLPGQGPGNAAMPVVGRKCHARLQNDRSWGA